MTGKKGGSQPGAGRKLELVKVKLSDRARKNLEWLRANNPKWIEDISLMVMLDRDLEEEVSFYKNDIPE